MQPAAAGSTTLDDRLGELSEHKLSLASGEAPVDSPPFYNCFFNRFTESSVVPPTPAGAPDDADAQA